MAEIILWHGKEDLPQTLPDGIIILWQGRKSGKNIISLEERLDGRLLEIRAEHMRWAYETGFLPLPKGGTLGQALQCGDALSMWWTSLLYERHPKLSPFLFDIYKLRCLELILPTLQPSRILVLGGSRPWRDIVLGMCLSRQWKVSFAGRVIREDEPRDWKEKIYRAIPAMPRAIIRYAHWLWQIWRKLPSAAKAASQWQKSLKEAEKYGLETATIASYFPNIDLKAAGAGRFRSRYWEVLHELLNAQAKKEKPAGPHFVRWLFIRFPSPDLTFDQCLALKNEFQKQGKDGISFNYLEEFLSCKDLCSAFARWFKISLKSFALKSIFAQNCHFQNSKINFWPYMQEQWAESFRGWRCLERCLQNLAFRRYFSMAKKQRWTLYPLENCPWERMLVQNARAAFARQPVYGSQHSIVRPTDFRYFDDPRTFSEASCRKFQPDVVGGNGMDACGQFAANGMPQKYLRRLEALRYLYLAKYVPGHANQEMIPPETGEPLAYNGPMRLLLLTSFFADETSAHLRLLGEALDKDMLSGWHITIKPHPYLPVDEWLAGRSQRQDIRIGQGPLEEFMTSGVLVWASNSTTAALDAILRGLAVMVMRPHGDFDLCPAQNILGLQRTGNLQELAHGLKYAKPLKPPLDYLDLDVNLPAWRKLLGLEAENDSQPE